MKTLIVVYSYPHNNTRKVDEAISGVLNAEVKTPLDTSPSEMSEYDLVGFGSGIYGDNYHPNMLELVDRIPIKLDAKAFLFSTGAMTNDYKKTEDHQAIREKL